MIDTLVEEEVDLRKNPDSLEHFLHNSDYSNPVEFEEISTLFDDSQDRRTKFWQPRFEELLKERVKLKPSTEASSTS